MMDLQLIPDAVCGCLLDLTDRGIGARDQRLCSLHEAYEEFCKRRGAY